MHRRKWKDFKNQIDENTKKIKPSKTQQDICTQRDYDNIYRAPQVTVSEWKWTPAHIHNSENISNIYLVTSKKIVFSMDSHWVHKPCFRLGLMPSSRWPTQNKVSGTFGFLFSNNALPGDFIFLISHPTSLLCLYYSSWFCVFVGFLYLFVFLRTGISDLGQLYLYSYTSIWT